MRLLPGYVSGDTAFGCGVIDLFSEFRERRRILKKVIHQGAGYYTGRVCSRHNVGIDLVRVKLVIALFTGGYES